MEDSERTPVFHTRRADTLDRRLVINAADQIVEAASLEIALAELTSVADIGDAFPLRVPRIPGVPRQSRHLRRGDDPPLTAPV